MVLSPTRNLSMWIRGLIDPDNIPVHREDGGIIGSGQLVRVRFLPVMQLSMAISKRKITGIAVTASREIPPC
jgi:hypothetical protein